MTRRAIVAAEWTVEVTRQSAAVLSIAVNGIMSAAGARPAEEIALIEDLAARFEAAANRPLTTTHVVLTLSSPEIVLMREAARRQVRNASRWPAGNDTGAFFEKLLHALPDTSDIVSAIGALDGPRSIVIE